MLSRLADDEAPRRLVVAYDIPGDSQRSSAARVLSGYGRRVQFSVFECSLGSREQRRMLRDLKRALGEDDGVVQVFECGTGTASELNAFRGSRHLGFWVA